jgi:hypothetical protein
MRFGVPLGGAAPPAEEADDARLSRAEKRRNRDSTATLT